MKKTLLIALIVLFGCNGELENSKTKRVGTFTSSVPGREPEGFTPNFDEVKKRQVEIEIKPELEEIEPDSELTQDIIERSAKYEYDLPVNEIDLENGFRQVGVYNEKIWIRDVAGKLIKRNCGWEIHKKEYEVTWLYVHTDCNGNRIKIHKDKDK